MSDTIPGQQVINVGLPNESTGSDSLYTAFNKTKNNFANLFACASPYTNFSNGVGIGVNANANTGTVTITNTGVTNIIAGTSIIIDQSNGNVTISSTGGGNGSGGTVTSVGVNSASASRITVSGSPVTASGTILLDLATTGVTGGTYTYPTVTVDNYGRITSIASASSTGTVSSVGVTPGDGIQVTGSPVTTSGNITITNTGVTRLNAGTGILLSGSNGNVTVSASLTGGTVTSVGVQSSTLSVTGSPVTTTGIININLPNTISLSGNITGSNLIATGLTSTSNLNVSGNAVVSNLSVTGTLSAGDISVSSIANGTSNVDIVGTGGNVTTSVGGNANVLVVSGSGAVVNGTLTTTGNITGGNITTSGIMSSTGNATHGNISTGGIVSATGNITTTGNIVINGGNIIYTPRYGAFYSNVSQTNPVANTAMAMTFNNTFSANNVSVVSSSRLTIAKTGPYNIQFSAQVTKSGGGTANVDIWLNKNGSPVAWTNTTVPIATATPAVAAWNFVEDVTVANTYYEIMWSSPATDIALTAVGSNTNPTRPGVPSVIVTITPVGA